MAYVHPDRDTIIRGAAELDTLSEMLSEANDAAVLDEILTRLAMVSESLMPYEEPVPTTVDPALLLDPTV